MSSPTTRDKIRVNLLLVVLENIDFLIQNVDFIFSCDASMAQNIFPFGNSFFLSLRAGHKFSPWFDDSGSYQQQGSHKLNGQSFLLGEKEHLSILFFGFTNQNRWKFLGIFIKI
jgi:hypothetical protein